MFPPHKISSMTLVRFLQITTHSLSLKYLESIMQIFFISMWKQHMHYSAHWSWDIQVIILLQRVNSTVVKLNCVISSGTPWDSLRLSLEGNRSPAWDTSLWMLYNELLTLTWTCDHNNHHHVLVKVVIPFYGYFDLKLPQWAFRFWERTRPKSGSVPNLSGCASASSKDYMREQQQHHKTSSRPHACCCMYVCMYRLCLLMNWGVNVTSGTYTAAAGTRKGHSVLMRAPACWGSIQLLLMWK